MISVLSKLSIRYLIRYLRFDKDILLIIGIFKNCYFSCILQWKPEGRKRQEIKKEIYVMLASFYLVWIAYVSVSVLILLGYQVPEQTQLASALLTKFGVIINPFVFVFRNKEVSELQYTQTLVCHCTSLMSFLCNLILYN